MKCVTPYERNAAADIRITDEKAKEEPEEREEDMEMDIGAHTDYNQTLQSGIHPHDQTIPQVKYSNETSDEAVVLPQQSNVGIIKQLSLNPPEGHKEPTQE